jgi:hypothetical protein
MRETTHHRAMKIFVAGAAVLALFTLNVSAAWAGPDLTVAAVDSSGVTAECQSAPLSGTISATIDNIGDLPAGGSGGYTVLFFEDADGNNAYDAGVDNVLAVADQDGLAAGATAVVSAPVSGSANFRDNLIFALVDSNNEVAEDDETNNLSNSGFGCLFVPATGAFTPVLEWSWTASGILPTSLNVMMTPGVIDLNADGTPDIVFGSTASTGGGLVESGVLRALDGASGSELFTVTDTNYYISTTASVAVGDIDADGRPEILACDSTGARLIAFEHDGSYKWRSPYLEAVNWGAPSIADLDGDGAPEIIVGRQVLTNDGTIRWTGAGGRGSQGSVGPISVVADLDMDGTPEIVAGNTAYTAAGAIYWRNTTLPDGLNAVADFDDDPFPEIVLVTSGRVYLLEHTGVLKWGPVSIPGGGAGGPPTVADYDNDGQVEIGVAGAVRYVVFETDGTVKWAAITQDSSSNRTGSSVFDFEGDGSAEVVYSDELTLRVYRGTDGDVLFETPLSSCTWHEYPLVADVDGDGNAEIIAVANNNCGFGPQRGIYVYGDARDNWVATREIWNQHAYHITNINDDGTIPAVEANNWESFNNFRQNIQIQGSVFAAPDLTASRIQLDRSDCPDAIGITVRIGNGGSNVAAAPVNVAFYNGDPGSGSGGSLLATAQTLTNLHPGQYEDVTITLPVPLDALTICVVADDDGAGNGLVSECNETNNQCCAQFTAFCDCVDDLAARIKSGKVQLTWSHLGAAGYNVYRSTTSGGPYLFLAHTASTYCTYLDTSVVDGTTYYYVVRPVLDSGDEFCQSNEADATPVALRRR